MKYIIPIFVVILFVVSSCGDDKPNLHVDLKKHANPEINIKRYEQLMFSLPQDSFNNSLGKYNDEFPIFFSTNLDNESALLQLKLFFTDPSMIELNQLVQDKYENTKVLKDELMKAMKHYQYYYGTGNSYNFYTYVSGLDIEAPITLYENNVIIGLDLYLGEAHNIYSINGFPKYKSKWLKAEALVPDILSSLAESKMPQKEHSSPLLDQMLHEGKRLFFIQSMMPDISEALLLHYTESQLQWCYENEARLWSLMVENQFLFKNEVKMLKKFMDDGPFTSILSTEAPARLGHFIGWRIISKYASRTGKDITEIITEDNAQQILKKSKYKPNR